MFNLGGGVNVARPYAIFSLKLGSRDGAKMNNDNLDFLMIRKINLCIYLYNKIFLFSIDPFAHSYTPRDS